MKKLLGLVFIASLALTSSSYADSVEYPSGELTDEDYWTDAFWPSNPDASPADNILDLHNPIGLLVLQKDDDPDGWLDLYYYLTTMGWAAKPCNISVIRPDVFYSRGVIPFNPRDTTGISSALLDNGDSEIWLKGPGPRTYPPNGIMTVTTTRFNFGNPAVPYNTIYIKGYVHGDGQYFYYDALKWPSLSADGSTGYCGW